MTSTEDRPISVLETKIGQEMSVISFGELVEQLTGVPFEEVYKDYLIHGDANAKSYME